MIFSGLHRVQITGLKIANIKENIENIDNITDELVQNSEDINSLIKKESDDIFISTIRKMFEEDFKLTLDIEAKLKHLIDLYSRILYYNND